MRHRSIAHLLLLTTACLALFVLYQARLKPAYFPPPAPPTSPDEPASFAPVTDRASPAEPVVLPDLQQTRLIAPGQISDPRLQLLWDQLERGHLREVEARLRKFSKEPFSDARRRQYLAAIWNNLGVQQEKYGGADLSVNAFKEAAMLDETNATVQLNLTQAYWARHDPAMSEDFLIRVIRLAPADPFPRLALAELLMERGDYDAASQRLEETAQAVKRQPDLEAYAQRLQARLPEAPDAPAPSPAVAQRTPDVPMPHAPAVAKGGKPSAPQVIPVWQRPAPLPKVRAQAPDTAPRQFRERAIDRFTIRFDGKEDQDTWIRLRAILEYADRDISQKFGYAPSAPIPVVLHTGATFEDPSGTPAWADALFEQTGVIHVPGRGALDDLGLLSRVIRHQFVHAALREKLGAKLGNVPHWLIEGLALILTEDPWPAVEDAKAGDASPIPLRALQGGWHTLADDQAALAYLESASATQHLIDRYSMYEVRQLLNLIQSGHTLETAMQSKLSASFDSFERQWTAGMTSRLKSGKS